MIYTHVLNDAGAWGEKSRLMCRKNGERGAEGRSGNQKSENAIGN